MNVNCYTDTMMKREHTYHWRQRLLAGWMAIGTCLYPTLALGQIDKWLKVSGMENIRCTEAEGTTYACFEDNQYRSTYQGIGRAIEACLSQPLTGDLQLVVLEERVPRLCITLPHELTEAYRKGEADLKQVYSRMGISIETDEPMQVLQASGAKEQKSSAWKTDLVIYPGLFLENNTFDELYTYAVNLNPTIEMELWKGARLAAQVIVPVVTNLSGEMNRVRPGIVAVTQEARFRNNWFGRISAGNFTNNRYGVQVEAKHRSRDGRIEVGGVIGSTGFSALTKEDGWYMGRKQRINASVNASYYEPTWNLELKVRAGRYVYGDYGVRGDCVRHFGENSIGVYALTTGGKINGGFYFAVPLPGKRWKRNGFFRIKPADYFAWNYGMVAHGEYVEKRMEREYNVRPNENASSRFYQPDYIRYFLVKTLKSKKERLNDK